MNDLDALLDKDTSPFLREGCPCLHLKYGFSPVWISYGRQFTKGNNKKRR